MGEKFSDSAPAPFWNKLVEKSFQFESVNLRFESIKNHLIERLLLKIAHVGAKHSCT